MKLNNLTNKKQIVFYLDFLIKLIWNLVCMPMCISPYDMKHETIVKNIITLFIWKKIDLQIRFKDFKWPNLN